MSALTNHLPSLFLSSFYGNHQAISPFVKSRDCVGIDGGLEDGGLLESRSRLTCISDQEDDLGGETLWEVH